jgi:hypothetical protein
VLEVRASSLGPGPHPEGRGAVSQRSHHLKVEVEIAVLEAGALS